MIQHVCFDSSCTLLDVSHAKKGCLRTTQNPAENSLIVSLRIMACLIPILPLVMKVDALGRIDLRFLRVKRSVLRGKAYWTSI